MQYNTEYICICVQFNEMDIFIIIRVFWQPYSAYSRLFTGVYLLYVYVYMHVCVCTSIFNDIKYQITALQHCFLLLVLLLLFFFKKQSDMYIFGMIINTYKGVHHAVNFTFKNVTREHCDGCALFCSLLFLSTNFVNVCFLFVQVFICSNSILKKFFVFYLLLEICLKKVCIVWWI